jgi:hypothetical protein
MIWRYGVRVSKERKAEDKTEGLNTVEELAKHGVTAGCFATRRVTTEGNSARASRQSDRTHSGETAMTEVATSNIVIESDRPNCDESDDDVF